MSFDISQIKENNSDLLKLLTDHLPDMLWVKDTNGVYLYANQAICDGLLMAKDTQEPIGKGDVFFALREREAHADKPDWHTFGELCFNSDEVVIQNNKAMKFEEHGNVKGKLMYLEVYKAPFYDKDGNIIGTVGGGRDITELKKIQTDLEESLRVVKLQEQEIHHKENYDALTNLPNKNSFVESLEQSIYFSNFSNAQVAVLFVDLDNFKAINDSLGHDVGDDVIIEVSKRMTAKIKDAVCIARFGGDEFAIIFKDEKVSEKITSLISDVMSTLNEPIIVSGHTLFFTMSIGVSICPYDGEDANSLLKNADAAMYKAKNDGKNTYSFYNEDMTQKAYEKIFLESALKKAIENDEFVVYVQPQMDVEKNRLIGVEALIRWQHDTMGMIYPDKFIPLAESNGMIVHIDRLMMRQAVHKFCALHKKGCQEFKLSMNLSIRQIEQDDFFDFLVNLLEDEGCLASQIELEVTESHIMNHPEKSIAILQKLSDLGVSIAIDDFGTGYSSLAYLKKLPINKLKIDREFISGLPDDAEDIALSKTIISLCQNLNLKVIGEGAETKEQVAFLLQHGCKEIQGYYYSKPIPWENLEEFILSLSA